MRGRDSGGGEADAGQAVIQTYAIDERTRARVGYPDGHLEIEVDLPFPLSVVQKTATRSLSAEAIRATVPAIRHALAALPKRAVPGRRKASGV